MPRAAREIPWLEQRNGVYNVRWYEPPTEEQKAKGAKGTTKRFGLRTRCPDEAQAKFAAFLSTGFHKETADGQLTVAAALEQYLNEHVEDVVVDKGRTRTRADHLKEFFGSMPLPSVGLQQFRAYKVARRKSVTNSTIRRELVVLRAAMNHALANGAISPDKMPVWKKVLPTEDDDGQEARWFTKDELGQLCERATGRVKDFIVLAYWWGARRNSVEKLETYQVKSDRVNLQKAGQQVTNKRRPVVPIFPEQRETLERLVGQAEGGWLFGPRWQSYPEFNALCRDCGFDENRRHPHMLRHSRVTHLLMDGVPIVKVAGLLGDSLPTVARRYTHYNLEAWAS